MTEDEIRTAFIEELVKVAPDLDAAGIGATDHLQDDLGLDSMDVLNLVAALHARLGVDVPEADYPRIATPASAATYLASRLAPPGA
ncbi:acyl carrier protein [Albimonas sp. CAU 1670]|uniref:acyl carrier protein n=1 Tax=Albimonas sp. CAU 1670 TaxID=3032599 RepID=UPI0023DBF7ED|nr:acyl carrier protein [Albimonas sp. CAU 1670]MDF2234836.1 acyl carrier protein [Albimonas sp. CAU 1670]